MSITTAATATSMTVLRRRDRRPARSATLGAADGTGVGVVATASSDASTAAAESGRSDGSFARHCITSAASAGGTLSDSLNGGGGSVRCAVMSACGVMCRANGCAPASISYESRPHAYRSVRWSTVSATACSGAMYAGVPIEPPACVSVALTASLLPSAPPSAPSRCRSPRSSACPSCSRTFSALMSRCITPWRCA